MLATLTASALFQSSALQKLTYRLVGNKASHVEFHLQPGDKDSYHVTASNGKVTVEASTGPAAARGLYDYLQLPHNGQPGGTVQWDGTRLNLGKKWWNADITASSPAKYRHYYNVCTFGYTTAFWDWSDWSKEIDWMALHGLNFPLAMDGQEAVWEKVWRKHGLTDNEIRSYFSGPAFLPWHRMGNINSHAGPLPQSWIDNQATLQTKILSRMRSIGITPVVPAFSGFIPPVFAAKHPELKTRKSSAWAGFDSTVLLDPRDPMFRTIGKEFIDTYRQMYGANHYYLADVYNEMTPVVSPETKYEDLKSAAAGVYDAIKAGDSEGIWVTQGWLFFNESNFWHEPEISAYLSGVPKDKIILLDLYSEYQEIWRRSPAFKDRPYIWNMLHGFGGQTPLFGNMDALVKKVEAAQDDPDHGQLQGMGMTMEGINQNPAMYELMSDLMWHRPASADDWFQAYLARRWGSFEAAKRLSAKFKTAFYSGLGGRTFLYQRRPTLDQPDDPQKVKGARELAEAMLAEKQLLANPLYRHDLADVAKEVVGEALDQSLVNSVTELKEKKSPTDAVLAAGLFQALDGIVSDNPNSRLSSWVNNAKKTVAPNDRNLLAYNARLQVTQWGGPVLSEYAAKEWSGLISNYYQLRWIVALGEIASVPISEAALDKEILGWENTWIKNGPDTSLQPKNWPKAVRQALNLAAQVKPLPDTEDKGIAVGKPATDSGHTEQGGDPANAVDGKVSGSWWSASPAPQWWQVDLQTPQTVGRVHIYTYYGDNRYYQYTVQTSLDGQVWDTVADMSGNTKESTRTGFDHAFAPRQARFIRVNMLVNSANVGVHLREVRVFIK